jgi:hypothetical protein
MNFTITSTATAIAGVIALGPGSMTISAQVTVDVENRYSNVGAIMVWRVDDAGQAVELRGFVSGTLIRDRVMVTAGHFTAPATALGSLPPSIRIVASFSPTDAKDSKTWIPVVRLVTHPSMPHCPPPPQCDPTDEILVAPLEPGIADVGLVFLESGVPGRQYCEESSTRPGGSGPYQATSAPATPVAAFFCIPFQVWTIRKSWPPT